MELSFWNFIKMEKNCQENPLTGFSGSDIISHAFKREIWNVMNAQGIDVPEQLKSGKEHTVTHIEPVNW